MRRCTIAILATSLTLFLATNDATAQPAAGQLPDGLRHVPPDALGFVHIRAGEFLKSGPGVALLAELQQDREAKKGLQEIERTLGITPADLDSITLILLPPTIPQVTNWHMMPGNRKMDIMPLMPKPAFENKKIEEKKDPEGKASPVLFQDLIAEERLRREVIQAFQRMDVNDMWLDVGQMDQHPAFARPLVIVTATKEFDRRKILKASLTAAPHDPSVLFLTDRTVMFGGVGEVARYSELMGRKQSAIKDRPLESALALGSEPHLLVAGGHLPQELSRYLVMPFNPDARMFAAVSPLMHTNAGLTLDVSKNIAVTLHFQARTQASAENAFQAVKSLRVLGELVLEKTREVGESGGWKLEMEKGLARALAEARIEQKDKSVRAELRMDVTPAMLKRFTKEIVAAARRGGDRTHVVNNLKQLAISVHSYHDVNKRLPPAAISSFKNADGKPLLSWRVAILPYLDQVQLYRQFDLDQPWDHPTNKKLIDQMPAIYVIPGAETKPGMTHFRTLVGPDTMMNPENVGGILRTRFTLATIPDGTSNTIMIVEATDPTIWTRPDDLPYDPKGPLPKFGVSPDGFHVALGDGSVRFIRSTISEATLRNAITCSDGLPLGPDWDRQPTPR